MAKGAEGPFAGCGINQTCGVPADHSVSLDIPRRVSVIGECSPHSSPRAPELLRAEM